MPDLRVEVERLLTSTLPDAEQEQAMWALVRADEGAFARFDGRWALRLYERSPYIFCNLITYVISKQEHLEVLEELLRRAEADNQQQIFQPLYRKVATQERWNTDVMNLVSTAQEYDTILRGLIWRKGEWAVVGEDVLVALFRRDPAAFSQKIGSTLLYGGGGTYFHQLPPGRLEFFRRELAKHEAVSSGLYYKLFRSLAAREEWLDEVRRLLRERPENIAHELTTRHPDDTSVELPSDLLEALVKTIGDAVKLYLERYSGVIIRRRFEGLLQSEPDDAKLLSKLQAFLHLGARFQALTPVWAMALYERNAEFFAHFIAWHADRKLEPVKEVLARARQDGRYDFYRQLAASRIQEADWNADLADVLRGETVNLMRELDRLDMQKEREGRWHNVFLTDDNAAALYRRGPFQEFIWRYLKAGSRDYNALIAAVHEAGDMEFALRLIRKVASPAVWQQEMKRLLEQDIPPERIVEELEKRRPVNVGHINPAILGEFMGKYGAAVLPFFERYLDWTTPARLNKLLDLDLERAVLLRELQAIARCQPVEFAEKANVWAPRLYERSPEFFSPFITQHLNWNSHEIANMLLQRMEAAGQDKAFRELYTRFYRREAWHQDIARLLRSGLDDDALHAALMRRENRSSHLPDDLAAELYQRNPDLFRQFITEHIGSDYGHKPTYDRLGKAAGARGDSGMGNAINEATNPAAHWQRQMEALLRRDVPPDKIVGELERLLPRNAWGIEDFSILAKFVEKYGDAVMSFLLGEQARHTGLHRSETVRRAVERHASKANHWRFAFGLQHAQLLWKNALEALAAENWDEATFRRELAFLTPDNGNNRTMNAETLALLYRRYPEAARPFIERFVTGYSPDLYQLAQEHSDDDLLDLLTYHMMLAVGQLVWRAFPVRSRWNYNKPDEKAQQQIAEMGAIAAARFDQLYAQSPEQYIRHAARVLSFIEAFQFGWGRWSRPSEHNPIWTYLTTHHHDDWRRSPEGITELLESPSIYVQLMALDILSDGSADSAARVVENLLAFRALLLSDARKATKRKALACLEGAAHADSDAATRIIPLLNMAMDFNARRAVSDDIAVAYARMEAAHAG